MMLMAILLAMLVMVLNSACQDIVIQIIIAEIVSNDLSHFCHYLVLLYLMLSFFVLVSIDINYCASDPCRNDGNCTVRIVV